MFWRNVSFLDIDETLLFDFFENHKNKEKLDKFIYIMFQYLFSEEKPDKITYVEFGYYYNFATEGLELKTKSYVSISKLENWKSINESLASKFLEKVYSSRKNSCSINVKSQFSVSSLIYKEKKKVIKNSLALLIPTKNHDSEFSNSQLYNSFIPSFLKTVSQNEYADFKISFYLGFDDGDALFDKNEKGVLDLMYALLPESIEIKIFKFPKIHWLNYIWNRLFIEAYIDGFNYFLQLNDDVKFISSSWITSSINILGDRYGVVGLSDNLYPCRLFSQVLVNRNHFDVFDGQFYPLTFKNWCSDEWIKNVYANFSICNPHAKIINYHPNRYDSCDRRNYLSEVKNGKEIFMKKLFYK